MWPTPHPSPRACERPHFACPLAKGAKGCGGGNTARDLSLMPDRTPAGPTSPESRQDAGNSKTAAMDAAATIYFPLSTLKCSVRRRSRRRTCFASKSPTFALSDEC